MEDIKEDIRVACEVIPQVRNTFLTFQPPKTNMPQRSRSAPVSSTCDRYVCDVHVLMFKQRPLQCDAGDVSESDVDIGDDNCSSLLVKSGDTLHSPVRSHVAASSVEAEASTLVADEVWGATGIGHQLDGTSDDDESTCASLATPSSTSIQSAADIIGDDDAWLARVPRDDAGNLTSIGSVHHEIGGCRPCAYFGSEQRPCQNGAHCRFCHFPHVKRRARLYKKRKLEIKAAVNAAVASAGSSGITWPPRYVPISWAR